jgi:glycine cleavage system aminomethyltransferase T
MVGLLVPGIYAGRATKAYREWLPAQGLEASASLGGSLTSDDINDCVTPYDMGYANIVKFDHDFIGADALRRIQAGPHRRKVWLRWNREDVTQLLGDALYSPEQSLSRRGGRAAVRISARVRVAAWAGFAAARWSW